MPDQDEDLPAPVKRQRRIILLLFSPAIGNWVYELLVNLVLEIRSTGKPNWQDLVDPKQFVASLTLSAILVLAYLCYYLSQLRHLPKLFVKLDALTELQEKVRVSGVEAVGAVTRLIDRVLGTSLNNQTLSQKHADSYNQSIEALGFKFSCWFEPVIKSHTNGRPDMVDTWLRYSRTYNFEEAFDIKRREIATNSRNFTYLILATLDSLASHCKQKNTDQKATGHKVVHIAVTPVHPKDWFNWPHGIGNGKAYFEEDFITHFWRCLREIKDAPGNKEVMRLERYILSAKDAQAQKVAERKLGRRLKTTGKVKESLAQSWILPVSAPLEQINGQAVNAQVKDAILNFYSGCITRAGYLTEKVNIIPMICRTWKEDEATIKNSLASLQNPAAQSATGLVAFAKEHQKSEIKTHKDTVDSRIASFPTRVKEVWKQCSADCDMILGGRCDSLHQFIVNCHKLDARLCEHSDVDKIYEVQEELRALVAAVLRFDDCLHSEQTWPNSLPCIGEVFTNWLHFSHQDLKLVELDESDITIWFNRGLRNEFHLFGVESPEGSIDWRILVAADINEPFQVVKILLLEEGAPPRREAGKNLAGFQHYKELIEKLRQKRGPFNDATGKVEIAWTP